MTDPARPVCPLRFYDTRQRLHRHAGPIQSGFNFEFKRRGALMCVPQASADLFPRARAYVADNKLISLIFLALTDESDLGRHSPA